MEEDKVSLKENGEGKKTKIIGLEKPVVVKTCDDGENEEGGWAWVICVVCFTVHLLFNAQVSSTTIYFVTFLETFQQSRSDTSWIFGVQSTAVCLASPIAGIGLRKWGPRWVIIVGSVLMASSMAACYFATSIVYLMMCFFLSGTGGSLIFTSAIAAPAIYFKKRLFVVTGIAISGSGLGILLIGPLLEWAVDKYGWRGAILLQGGLMLQGVVCGALMFPPTTKKTDTSLPNSVQRPPSSTTVLLRDARTWLIIICMFQHFLNFTTFVLMIKDYAVQERAIGVSFSVVTIVMGLSNTFGRLISGFISKAISPSVLFALASFVVALAMGLMVLVSSDWIIVFFIGVASFGYGQQAVLMNLMTASIFGGVDMATVFSYGLVCSIAGVLGAPSIIGYMKDVTGSYIIPLVVMIAGVMMAAVCSLLAYFLHRRRQQQKRPPEAELLTT